MRKKIASIIGRYDNGVWIRVIGTSLTTITSFMIRPFLVLYLYDKLEGSIILPMIIVGLQPLCGMVVSWFGGGLSDRYGRKPLMFCALLLQMSSMIGYTFATEVWHYALISIVNGIGFALFMPAANAQMADTVPEERRAEVFALLHTAFNIGSAVGPLVGLLLFNWSPKVVFAVSACAFLCYALLVLFKLKETAPLMGEQVRSVHRAEAKSRLNWRAHRPLLMITLLSLPIGLLYAQVETTFPLHLATHFDNSRAIFPLLLTFNGIMVIAMQIWIARKTETKATYVMMALSYGLFAAVSFGYGFLSLLVILFVTEFVFTIGEMISGPHLQKAVSVLAPENERGFYFAVYGSSQMITRGLGPILGGLLFSWAGGATLFAIIGCLLVLSGIGQYRVIKGLA